MKVEEKYRSSTHYLLSALIPYTEANLKLSFLPKRFFTDLSRLDRIKESTLRNAFYRSIKSGYIEVDHSGTPRLTATGQRRIAPFHSTKLKDAQLMVIFDIPESDRWKRTRLRATLKEFGFCQIQKSVWTSPNDCREYLKQQIKELDLGPSVRIYESNEL